MNRLPLNILLIEDQLPFAQLLREYIQLSDSAWSVTAEATTLRGGLQHIENQDFDLIVVDLGLPDSDGLPTFVAVHDRAPQIPIIVISGTKDERVAFETVHRGAQDYLSKDEINRNLLAKSIRYAMERQRLRWELVKARTAAEGANLSKSEFLNNMSHELRTPLNAVIGFSRVLQDQNFGELNERQQRYVNNILNSGQRLLSMVNDVLDVSRFEAGKMLLGLTYFNVSVAILEELNVVREAAQKRQISLETDIDNSLPKVNADPHKFRQILYNLLSNAIKFTPEGGSVKVSASATLRSGRTSREALPDSNQPTTAFLRVSVSDNGIGVAPENNEKIFGEFQQLDASYDRDNEGTGLGLALTKRLVALHGGNIWVESEGSEGRGSDFIFEIPLEPISLQKQVTHDWESSHNPLDIVSVFWGADGKPDKGSDSKATALIIDDDCKLRAFLKEILEAHNLRVIAACDGEEGMALAIQESPDVIVLDLSMPEVTGFDVMQQVREHPRTQKIPIMVYTAAHISDRERRQLDPYVQAIVPKCVGVGELVREVRRLGKIGQLNRKTLA